MREPGRSRRRAPSARSLGASRPGGFLRRVVNLVHRITLLAWRGVAAARRRVERRADTNPVIVSVIVPVYNAGKYLDPLIESLVAQDLEATSFEVIAVDDGSTDGSGEALDRWAGRIPMLIVVHQENSGWPGAPRNRGLDMSRGRYVFFADADDVLAPTALSALTAFADRHQSDIVIPRIAGIDGRKVLVRHYRRTRIDAPLELAFHTLSPQKLFRRSLLVDHEIRFPVGRVRLEDGMFLARAYLSAWRVSVLARDDLYYLRRRTDVTSISHTTLDPSGYSWSVGEVARLVRAHDDNPDRADRIVLALYRLKCLKIYEPSRWTERYSEETKREWLVAHGAFIDRHIPAHLEAQLDSPYRERSEAARTGDLRVVERCCEVELRARGETS